jgi:hypothetical protein
MHVASGLLFTTYHTLEQNREVCAVPGPADSLASRRCSPRPFWCHWCLGNPPESHVRTCWLSIWLLSLM